MGTQDVSPKHLSFHDSEISGLEFSSVQLLAAFAMVLVDEILQQFQTQCCNS
jgi:hypothetical protein